MIIPKLAYIKYLIITNCEPAIASAILKELEEITKWKKHI